MASDWPEPRTETVTITYTAVDGPLACVTCGHDHYAWQSSYRPGLSPDWGRCVDELCKCHTLRQSRGW